MNILKNGMFSFLVIYTGVNAAQVFGATPTLGGVIGGVVTLTGMNPEAPIINLFNGQPLAAQQGGILGVIFAVWLLSKVEKKLHDIVPEAIDIIWLCIRRKFLTNGYVWFTPNFNTNSYSND